MPGSSPALRSNAQSFMALCIDGSVHGQPSQARRDAQRDAYLKALGHTVLRISNGMILEALELFVEKVVALGWSLPEAWG